MAKPKRELLIERHQHRILHVHSIDPAKAYNIIKSIEGIESVLMIDKIVSVRVSPLYDRDDIEAEIKSILVVPDAFKEF